MGKLTTYIMIMVGLILVFNLAGLTTISGTILGQIGFTEPEDLADLEDSFLYTKILWGIAALSGLTIILIGTLTRGTYITAIAAGIAEALLLLFVADLGLIAYTVGQNAGVEWLQWLTFTLMLPLMVDYVIATFDWIRAY
jgi:hypothetical protein